MEIFELRYFVEVARLNNIHRGAERLGISPASVSKAISRLEAELSCRLFDREGRNISLNAHGRVLLEKASRILELEESARVGLRGKDGELRVTIAGPEFLQAKFGPGFAAQVTKRYANASFEFLSLDEAGALEKVRSREAHFAIVSSEAPADLDSQLLEETVFVTVAGQRHPLLKKHLKGAIPVDRVLEHAFVSPNSEFLGEMGKGQSLDGWRDDKFPRRIRYRAPSLSLVEELVSAGQALAYVPDYVAARYVAAKAWKILQISGCPFVCRQKIRLVARKPIELGWIRQVYGR